MGKIIELNPEIYNRIAAGEVIENPASVVKELIENSIDAKSDSLRVIIKHAGKKEITIIDNGEGMSEDDVELSIKKHATSKIQSIDDLDKIQTLGFRGEALSSIVSVAQVEISSKTNKDEAGTRLSINEHGKNIKKSKVSMNTGTTIKVSNLFYHTPARLKFLKSDSKELLNIREALNRMIIPYYSISFEIIMDEEKPLLYKKRDTLLQRIEDVYGHELAKQLIPFKTESPLGAVSGYISKPAYNKPNRNYQFLFLHNRAITTKYFHYWLSLAYENLLIKDRYPIAFILMATNPDAVDVNVHPAKKEVRFSNEYAMGNILINAIKTALNQNLLIPEISTQPSHDQVTSKTNLVKEVKSNIDKAINTFLYKHSEKMNFEMPGQPAIQTQPAAVENFFTLFNTYIFYEDSEKKEVLIIDQHAAHERIIYERLKRELFNKEEILQNLLIPLHVHLSDVEFHIVMDHKEIFQEIGYSIEHFGGKTIIINSVPAYLRHEDDKRLFLDLISDLIDQKDINKKNIKEEILKSMACKSAIKAGDRIGKEQKETLIKDLLLMEGRYTCPHGRPAVIKLNIHEIEKWFLRT